MDRYARRLFCPSVAAIVLGASISLHGVIRDSLDVWRLGLLLAVMALPVLGYALIYRAARASDDQLADAHRAGYKLALYHVSLGLLDSPAAPPDGGEGVGEDDTRRTTTATAVLPDNVRPFRSRDDEQDTDTRKAV